MYSTRVVKGVVCAQLLGLCMQHNDNTVPNMDRKSLLHVIHHVIGIDKYTDNINSLVRSDAFVRAQESHLVWQSLPPLPVLLCCSHQ
jgi:hypothetical protein